MNYKAACSSLLLTLLTAGCASGASHNPSAPNKPEDQVQLLVSQSEDEGIVARIEFTNNSEHALFLDKINGCLDGHIRNDVFRITDASGAVIPYKLPLIKRLSTYPNEVAQLAPGSTVSTVVSLARAYKFPTGKQSFKITYIAVHTSASGNSVELTAETVATINVFAAKELTKPDTTRRTLADAEKEQVQQALEKTKELLTARKNELDDWDNTSQASKAQFASWFGRDNKSTRTKVQTAIQKAIDLASKLNLDDFVVKTRFPRDEEKVAAAIDEDLRKIVLYPVFFTRPETGVESMPGIIAHELFHFKKVAAAIDHRYGLDRCRQLAKDLPHLAVQNADNFEFYLEGID